MGQKLGIVKELNLAGCSVSGEKDLQMQRTQVIVQKEIDHGALTQLSEALSMLEDKIDGLVQVLPSLIEEEAPVIVKEIDHMALNDLSAKIEALELSVNCKTPVVSVLCSGADKSVKLSEKLDARMEVGISDALTARKQSLRYERAIVVIGLIDLVLNLLPYFR